MPSKFGEFRFLGAKSGKTMIVNGQAQKKSGGGAWTKCTASFSCGNTSVGNATGLIIGEKEQTSWNAQNWDEADQKRIVVRVQEKNSAGQVDSDMGFIITPNPSTGEPALGCTLSIHSSGMKAYVLISASMAKEASITSGQWNQGEYTFIN